MMRQAKGPKIDFIRRYEGQPTAFTTHPDTDPTDRQSTRQSLRQAT
jgi:hypothetical protein